MKSNPVTNLPSLRDLIAAGAHFGHRRERSQPAASKYTYMVRDGVTVINLEETQKQMTLAARFLEGEAARGAVGLFIGTKRQAKDTVKTVAEKTSLPYVSERWLGGTLTNFDVIRARVKRLQELETLLGNEQESAKYTKLERLLMQREAGRLLTVLGGIRELTNLPAYMIVVDPEEETTAVQEARRLEIPVIAICDSDSNPDEIDLPIPANDDAPKAIEVILNFLGEAILRGKAKQSEQTRLPAGQE